MVNSILKARLFTDNWINEFIDTWNKSKDVRGAASFIKTGPVLFGIEDAGNLLRSSILSWDQEGKVRSEDILKYNGAYPSFFAPIQVWEAVIYGYYTPIYAVANKKMRFKGDIKFAMRFSQDFEYISDVAITVNRTFFKLETNKNS